MPPYYYCDVAHPRPEYGEPWKEFVCGWSAALISIMITYPMGKMIFRQMLHGIRPKQAYQQLRFEGIWFLYRGILPPMIQRTGSVSIMFGVYEEIRRPLIAKGFDPLTAQLLASTFSGVAECVLTPFERVMTLLAHHKYHDKFKNTAHAFRILRRDHGIRELYRGFVPILLRNGPAAAVFFVAKDKVRQHVTGVNNSTPEWRKAISEFLSGAMIGACTSTMYFPLNVAKIQIQRKIGGDFQSIFNVMSEVYIARGRKIANMYKGATSNFVKSFLSWGSMNSSYEVIRDFLYECKPAD